VEQTKKGLMANLVQVTRTHMFDSRHKVWVRKEDADKVYDFVAKVVERGSKSKESPWKKAPLDERFPTWRSWTPEKRQELESKLEEEGRHYNEMKELITSLRVDEGEWAEAAAWILISMPGLHGEVYSLAQCRAGRQLQESLLPLARAVHPESPSMSIGGDDIDVEYGHPVDYYVDAFSLEDAGILACELCRIIEFIGEMREEKAIPLLRSCLDSPYTRGDAAVALLKLGVSVDEITSHIEKVEKGKKGEDPQG
jgi:hypothetical protein